MKIECIIMDWAGTAVDFGCFAPVEAFCKTFADNGIRVDIEEVRKPMGKAKIEHIRDMLQMTSINSQFVNVFHREWNEEDLIKINSSFEKNLFLKLSEYTTPIQGVTETINALRAQGIKIGSTTGYTRAMMNIVQKEAQAKGYNVDTCITPDNLPAGRPAPFMIFMNMINLNIQHLDKVVKVGDTLEDIREGLQAKVHVVGVVKGSSELGLSETEYSALSPEQRADKMQNVRKKMIAAGAHYVIDAIDELPSIVNQINTKLK